ncbi:hypothetical protein TSMEX_011676 [Taenia solium]|eukprot:TsM_001232200 transcript=TsM_001232200 gene=TsM_001232200
MKTVRFYISFYPRQLRIPLILYALPQQLLVAERDAEIPADSDIDQGCQTLAQLVNDQREQSLTTDCLHPEQYSPTTLTNVL